jgi:hypothetical protein
MEISHESAAAILVQTTLLKDGREGGHCGSGRQTLRSACRVLRALLCCGPHPDNEGETEMRELALLFRLSKSQVRFLSLSRVIAYILSPIVD